MEPFLSQVARHYYAQGDVDSLCFVLPNRRSCLFLKKYFASLAASEHTVMLCAPMVTMNDFVCSLDGRKPSGRISLLLDLYACYSRLNPKAESLDDFIFWGDTLLADFDDVDKYLADPRMLFTNVADWKALQDNLSYLDEVQRKALESFMGNFRTEGEFKEKFSRIWNILLPLYRDFNDLLSGKGGAYEGMIYRDVAQSVKSSRMQQMLSARYSNVRKFVFVGLNALNECERRILTALRNEGRAEFCWDYSSEWIKDPSNRSSFFLSDNVQRFPQAFEPDSEGLKQSEITVLGVPSAVGQAKQLPQILRQLGAKGIETAVVLPDEGLLMPVLNSIPEEISALNVTMGLPMKGSCIWDLCSEVAALQMHLRLRDGKASFYHKQVWSIVSNSILKTVLDEEQKHSLAELKAQARYYVDADSLQLGGLCSLIFRPVVTEPQSNSAAQIASIASYLQELLSQVAPLIASAPSLMMEVDFAKQYYQAVASLSRENLPVLPATWFRLLEKMLSSLGVPFKGEPLNGLQIMGPLETRALDFDNLIILSCNEGLFPSRNVSASFIPAPLRKAFALPTYEYQDAVWAYYFYRALQRCSKVWLLYDTRVEGVKGGEESRYIKQLQYHFEAPLRRLSSRSEVRFSSLDSSIPKTDEDVAIIRSKPLSASSLQEYLTCPAKFYYSRVKGLRKLQDVSEELDSSMFGTVFHEAMEKLYSFADKKLTVERLDALIKDEEGLENLVTSLIEEQMGEPGLKGKNLVHRDIICCYVKKCLEKDRQYIISEGASSLEILGLELKRKWSFGGFEFIGFLDRLDSVREGEVRIVDYKTGSVSDKDFLINSSNAEKIVSLLFSPDSSSSRPKIALQLYLYDRFIQSDERYCNCNIINTIYQPTRLHVKDVENISLCPEFITLMDEALAELLKALPDTSVPFRRSGDSKDCEYCDFKTICGR